MKKLIQLEKQRLQREMEKGFGVSFGGAREPQYFNVAELDIAIIQTYVCRDHGVDPAIYEIHFFLFDKNEKKWKSIHQIKPEYSNPEPNFYEAYASIILEPEMHDNVLSGEIKVILSKYVGFSPVFGNQYKRTKLVGQTFQIPIPCE